MTRLNEYVLLPEADAAVMVMGYVPETEALAWNTKAVLKEPSPTKEVGKTVTPAGIPVGVNVSAPVVPAGAVTVMGTVNAVSVYSVAV